MQQAALVTLWALTRRVGTRHLVYMILERALVCGDDARRYDVPMHSPMHLFHAVVALLRR